MPYAMQLLNSRGS